jgi:hypothetical protein
MRNDARPIGPDADDQSPLSQQHSRDVVDRESEPVSPRSRDDRRNVVSDPDSEPTMPNDDSTLNTKI